MRLKNMWGLILVVTLVMMLGLVPSVSQARLDLLRSHVSASKKGSSCKHPWTAQFSAILGQGEGNLSKIGFKVLKHPAPGDPERIDWHTKRPHLLICRAYLITWSGKRIPIKTGRTKGFYTEHQEYGKQWPFAALKVAARNT